MGKDPDEIREEIEETRERMSETVDALAYKADVPNRVQDAVSDKVDSVKSTITGTIGAVRDRVDGMRESVGSIRDRMGTVRDRITDAMPDTGDLQQVTMTTIDSIRENPLGLLFGAAAVGFLLGSLLPATDIENQRLGEFSDQLKQTAQATGGQIIEQGKAVVRDTIEAAKDAATQSAMQHGQNVAQSAMQGIQSTQSGGSGA